MVWFSNGCDQSIAQLFENPTIWNLTFNKSGDYEWFRIFNGQFLDPHCIYSYKMLSFILQHDMLYKLSKQSSCFAASSLFKTFE